MFKKEVTVEQLNHLSSQSMVEHLGIEFVEIGDEYLIGKMPVDHRTHQPFGFLHGGASLVLAETLGSVASNLVVGDDKMCFGQEINANHIKSARTGVVYGKVTCVHMGKSSHVWNIRITNEAEELICISRMTVAIITKKKE